ncbi:MAG TPA: AAA family ATPase [Candidatus Limnocylindria bacterium]|nr:AAA family ATPase [Candidatus Limnocylindria bacterium]
MDAERWRALRGRRLGGRYRVLELLEDAADGATVLASDVERDARAVISIDHGDRSAEVRARLETAAEALARLVAGAEVGHDGNLVYLARPFAPGVSLAHRLAAGPLAIEDALAVGRAVAEALAAAHAEHILHRRVRPESVIVPAESPIQSATLVGFVLFRRPAPEPAEARYLSPEQLGLWGHDIDERSDLYALGATLFHALAGRPPFDEGTVHALLQAHARAAPADVRRVRANVPAPLAALVARLLRQDPRDRYATAEGVRADLEAIEAAGRDTRVLASVVIGAHDRRRTLTEPALTGRASELAALEAVIERTRGGHGGLVLLEAESGGGKSRVLDEIAIRAEQRGLWVLAGGSGQQAAPPPFSHLSGVADGIAAKAARSPDWGGTFAARLGDRGATASGALPALALLFGARGDAGQGEEAHAEMRVSEALGVMLDALGDADRPALVLLDDCQWADELTVKLVAAWSAPRASPRHVCVVAAFRTEEVSATHPLRAVSSIAHVVLPPLEPGEVKGMLVSMAGPLPADAIEPIERLGSGNPFLVASLLYGLEEAGALLSGPGGWQVNHEAIAGVRSSLRGAAVLTQRLEQLHKVDPAMHGALSAGAVFGRELHVDDVAPLVGLSPDAVGDSLRAAARRHLVWAEPEPGRFRFVHDRLREALLERLSGRELIELQRTAAIQLERRDPSRVYELARLYDAAGEPARALPHAIAAGDLARAREDLESAQQYYEIARRGADGGPAQLRQDLTEKLGLVLMARRRFEAAAIELDASLALTNDPVVRARLEWKRGELEKARGTTRRPLPASSEPSRSSSDRSRWAGCACGRAC